MPNLSAKRSADPWLRDPTATATPESVSRRSVTNVLAMPPVPRIPHRTGLSATSSPFRRPLSMKTTLSRCPWGPASATGAGAGHSPGPMLRDFLVSSRSQCTNVPKYPDIQVHKPWHPAGGPIRAAVNGVAPMTEGNGRHTDAALVRRFRQARVRRGAHRRVASAGTAAVRKLAAAAGGGLLVVLLLLAFVWPGFLHSTVAFVPQASTTPSSHDPSTGAAPKPAGSSAVPSSSASPTPP